MRKQKFYNLEKDTTDWYTERWLNEQTRVRDVDNLQVWHHYWEDVAGDLWVDFNNPEENVHQDFLAYRQAKQYLTPEQLQAVRHLAALSIPAFAKLVGLSANALRELEQDQRVQTDAEERRLVPVWQSFQNDAQLSER
ncbi:hypothetical protein [Lactiplantibacillus fabifermentans]|uniref:Uncharacterized protein n=2 Tax=Lactiplantibacillus fabifermentans TaxID=483011 RepID=A0A0R2NE98_9LACO|nr:hypothetical protein [Lactiplantibacillus fabifermentans]ETY74271.1 hypothetical protein LFAB_08060 [Lactiplantibacillus fabifermentans T30PCM01]KRO23692.1 hypothetical protein DY78_GL001729 [Lactiplantibacillus fabifermentans DSM 21115]